MNEKHDPDVLDRDDPSNSTQLLPSNGDTSQSQALVSNLSVSEIPLSPYHLPSLHDTSPAVVAIDSLEADDDVIVTKELGKKNEKLILTERSPSIMVGDTDDSSVVCGSNGWCILS